MEGVALLLHTAPMAFEPGFADFEPGQEGGDQTPEGGAVVALFELAQITTVLAQITTVPGQITSELGLGGCSKASDGLRSQARAVIYQERPA